MAPTQEGPARTRVPNRWGQGERLRTEILRAAGRLLAQGGSEDSLSLRAIARETGIAAPSIYRHFRDKTEIVWEVLAGAYGELAAVMREAERSAGGSPREKLAAMADAYCQFAADRPRHYRLMFDLEQSAVPMERLAGHPVGEILDTWEAAVSRLLEDHPHPRLDARQLAILLWTALHGHVSLRRAMPVTDDVGQQSRTHQQLLTELLGPES
ncbi:TetR/AcrR family transcriptional regulator [Actinomadura sp. NPDC048394]|jgi:AcrR family transcriptional regulator|uniref:TetR/AcrR family transcriptional regulator n=1 Tax=Actinomadura sp. NPDC048394 TaxID=3158223 RepID=UPI003404E04D